LNTQKNSENGLFLPFLHLVSGFVPTAGGGAMSAWEAKWTGDLLSRPLMEAAARKGQRDPFVNKGGNFYAVVGIFEFKIFGFWEEQYGEGAGGFFLPLNFI
jgi:hypothetical protein